MTNSKQPNFIQFEVRSPKSESQLLHVLEIGFYESEQQKHKNEIHISPRSHKLRTFTTRKAHAVFFKLPLQWLIRIPWREGFLVVILKGGAFPYVFMQTHRIIVTSFNRELVPNTIVTLKQNGWITTS